MQIISDNPEPASALRLVRQRLDHVRHWPTYGNKTYSPLFCLLLLLAVGLMIEISR